MVALRRMLVGNLPKHCPYFNCCRTFSVGYSYGGNITGASLVAPCAVTHSINMNQRVIFLVSRRCWGYGCMS